MDQKYCCKVMVVDDDPDIEVFIAEQFKILGCIDVLVARNGNDALRMALSRNVDLIVSDLQMPEMDGIQLIRHLSKAKYRGGLVFMSSIKGRLVESAAEIAKSYNLKVLRYLNKSDVNLDVLESVLKYNYEKRVPIKLAMKTTPRMEEVVNAVKDKEFHFVYMPKVNISDGSSQGYEMLARWEHPKAGTLLPEMFLPKLLENKDIALLHHKNVFLRGLNVLMSLNRNRSLPTQCLNVNMPLSAFNNPDICDDLIELAKVHKVNPAQFKLELSCQDGQVDKVIAMEVLTRLRLNGFGLVLDNFGTSNANADMLLELPFSEIKIDRRFVENMENDKVAYTFIKMAIDMAKIHNVVVTAVGIVNKMQWSLLKSLGCDYAQGYFVSEPVDRIKPEDIQNIQERLS